MDFVILKVNGQDLSNSSHSEALDVFQNAKEPIIVEVVRRKSSPDSTNTPTTVDLPSINETSVGQHSATSSSGVSSNGSNGDIKAPPINSSASQSFPAGIQLPPPPPLPANSYGMGPTLAANPNHPIYPPFFHPSAYYGFYPISHDSQLVYGAQSGGLFDILDVEEEDERFDMDYEEVILHRSPNERLGLTLCYSPCEDGQIMADVYVSEIEAGSIAALDGRIREGDQILQINNQDVESRDQAVQLFRASGCDVTLLVARPQNPEAFYGPAESSSLLDNLHIELMTSPKVVNLPSSKNGFKPIYNEEGEKHEKDSGMGRTTDDSTRTAESSEHENEYSFNSVTIDGADHINTECLDAEINQLNHAMETLAIECMELERLKQQKQRLSQLQKQKQLDAAQQNSIEVVRPQPIKAELSSAAVIQPPSKPKDGAPSSDTSSNGPSNTPQLNGKPTEKILFPRLVPRMGTRLDNTPVPIKVPVIPINGNASGSSAYNTGDSNNSGSGLTLELSKSQGTDGSMLSLVDALPPPPLPLPHPYYTAFITPQHIQARQLPPIPAEQPPPPPVPSDSDRSNHTDTDSQRTRSSGNTQRSSGQQVGTPRASALKSKSNSIEKESTGKLSRDGSKGPTDSKSKDNRQGPPAPLPSHNIYANYIQHQVDNEIYSTPVYDVYDQFAQIMYTTPGNLEHTMKLQQQMFQATQPGYPGISADNNSSSKYSMASPYSNDFSYKAAPPTNGRVTFAPRLVSTTPHQESAEYSMPPPDDPCQQMEWVVKKRPDGSRYITRRPVRNRLLKERARRLTEERSGQTTDDDAMSEMKMGKYWNKSERRKHVEKAKEYRRRKKEALQKVHEEEVPGHNSTSQHPTRNSSRNSRHSNGSRGSGNRSQGDNQGNGPSKSNSNSSIDQKSNNSQILAVTTV